MAKATTYIGMELEWLESRAADLRKYVDANPIAELKDRIEWKPTSKGGVMPMVIASIEAQIKSIRDTMKDYTLLLAEMDKLREKEDTKAKARGNGSTGDLMRRINEEEHGSNV